MTGFLLRRLTYLLCLVVLATSVAYLLAATQLRPRARYEGRNPPPPVAVVDATLDQLNMNDKVPVLTRYSRWASGIVRGDLGRTIDNQSVNEEIGRRMWVSLRLVLVGALVGTGGAAWRGRDAAPDHARQGRTVGPARGLHGVAGRALVEQLATPLGILAESRQRDDESGKKAGQDTHRQSEESRSFEIAQQVFGHVRGQILRVPSSQRP